MDEFKKLNLPLGEMQNHLTSMLKNLPKPEVINASKDAMIKLHEYKIAQCKDVIKFHESKLKELKKKK